MKTLLFNTSLIFISFIPILVNGQYATITGYVTNAINGTYLENVNIYESGSVIGTLTDKKGFYQLILPVGTIKLSAKYNGFEDFTKQLEIDGDTIVSIQLKPAIDKKNAIKDVNAVQVLNTATKKPK